MLRKFTYFSIIFSLFLKSPPVYCGELDDEMPVKNRVAIIGGGYTGIISAILLAKLKKENGKKVFDVHLFERDLVLMNGASAVPARLHLGGEYPEDDITAKQCLFSAILFRQIFETESILTDIQHTDFLVAEASRGHDDEYIQRVYAQYENLRKLYEKTFNTLSNGERDEEIAKLLFGLPSKDIFFESLSPSGLFCHFAGGIRTKERGLQPIAFGVILEDLLTKHGVNIHLGCTVTKADYSSDEKKYTLSYRNQHSRKLVANYVVSAAWHRNDYLATKVTTQNPPQGNLNKTVFLRTIGLFDVSQCENPNDCSYFGFKGEHGGMVSFYSPTVAAIYIPKKRLSYQGEITGSTFLDERTQKCWDDLNSNRGDSKKVLERMLDNAKRKYPFLDKATPIKLLTRATISEDGKITQRPHVRPHWHRNRTHWLEAESTKATYAPVTALQVLERILHASGLKKSLQKSTRNFLTVLNKKDFENLIDSEDFSLELPEEFILETELQDTKPKTDNLDLIRNYQVFLSRMQLYALKRELPFEMMKQFSPPKKISSLDRQLQLMGPEQEVSLIDPVRQISLIHWSFLQDVDLRSITPTLDILRSLAMAIGNHTGSFEKFRFKYCDKHSTLLSQDHAYAGTNLLMALRGKLTGTLEIDRLFLTMPQEASAFIGLLVHSPVKNLTLTKFFTYTQTHEQRETLRDLFSQSLKHAKTLEKIKILFKDIPNSAMLGVLFSFQNIPNLKKLTISHNHIGEVLGEDNGVRNFQQVADFIKEARELEFLDLSYNDLFVDDREEFKEIIINALKEREKNDDLKYRIEGNGDDTQPPSELIIPTNPVESSAIRVSGRNKRNRSQSENDQNQESECDGDSALKGLKSSRTSSES